MPQAIEGIKSAESSKRKPRKVLDHIEVHPKMGGGHMVKHVYTSYEHEPKEVPFTKNQGTEAAKHILKHSGLSHVLEGEEGEAEKEGEEGEY